MKKQILGNSTVETGILLWSNRYAPIDALSQMAAAYDGSGVVDQGIFTDQPHHFVPPSLWTKETTPLAEIFPDCDSMDSPYVLAGYVSRQLERMGLGIMCDSIRHGPADLMLTLLTLADITKGRMTLHFGAGEVKNITPYGWRRVGSLEKYEDFFQIFHKLWNNDGPIDHDGNYWKFKQATLGSYKPYKPRIMAMGGGPRLLDFATTYADGVTNAAPCHWSTAEKAGKQIKELKKQLESKGRDPEAFKFGIAAPALIHENPEVLDRALDNKLVKFISGIQGRLDAKAWRAEGIEPAVPDEWNYFLHLKPHEMEQQFIDTILSKATREMVKRSWFIGSPKEVAAQYQAYIDAGVNLVIPCDYLPMITPVDDLQNAPGRSVEVCRLIKAANPAS